MPFDGDLILRLFETIPGRYSIQGTFYSIIAVIIINSIRRSWNINSPVILQRLHFVSIIMPPLTIPLYYLLNPSRNSPEWRLRSLIDIESLLSIEYAGINAGMVMLFLMIITALIFFLQEIIPVIKNITMTKREEEKRIVKTFYINFFDQKHEVKIIEDEEYIIFSSTGIRPSIYISTGLINDLSEEELDAALAHEAAHILRSKRPLLIAVFIFRVMMFFNPVVLIEFRKAVQEEEKICDRMALKITGNPAVFMSVLKRFIREGNEKSGSFNESSHNLLIKERLEELSRVPKKSSDFLGYESSTEEPEDTGILPLTLAIISTGVINYFIV